MADVPDEMMTKDRPPDPVFKEDELLFRRFSPDAPGRTSGLPDALELPDLSVNREKYGPPEWLLLDEAFAGWGVLAFRVGDIPKELLDKGINVYTFAPRHVPLKYNYPHSEVWAFRDGVHIDARNEMLLDPDLHLRWRQILIWKTRLVIFAPAAPE